VRQVMVQCLDVEISCGKTATQSSDACASRGRTPAGTGDRRLDGPRCSSGSESHRVTGKSMELPPTVWCGGMEALDHRLTDLWSGGKTTLAAFLRCWVEPVAEPRSCCETSK